MNRALFIAVIMCLGVSCGRTAKFSLTSPKASIRTQVELNDAGELSYAVLWGLDTIVSRSRLGLVVDGELLFDGFRMTGHSTATVDSTWTILWGANKKIQDRHKQLLIELKHRASGRRFAVNFVSHDDGVAFRYELPDDFGSVINDELTQINVTANPTTWWASADYDTYETEYHKTLLDSAAWIATPVIMRRTDGRHMAINEAAIINYPDMTLRNTGGGRLKVDLTPWSTGEKVRLYGAVNSPWRMITIAADAKTIVASSTMLNLAPPTVGDTARMGYCKPMTYMGIWWAFHLGTKEWKEGLRQGATTFEAMRYIDFASRHNVGGVVIEGWNNGWDKWGQKGAFDYMTSATNYDLAVVADYAKTCDVRLIMHHETGGDTQGYEAKLDSAFKLCADLGISAVKTGHAGAIITGEHHHGQQVVEHFAKILTTAARYGIALDLHEPVKGSGLERTYPNMMTREGVRGLEWEAGSTGNSPTHTTLLPFTRGLSGPMDYTPGIFDLLLRNAPGRVAWNTTDSMMRTTRVHSTLTHQLALMVTLYSPWVMAADLIDNYDKHPAFEFIKSLNPDYDETLVLEAEIGEYIVVARRTGNVWYVAGTTDDTPRTIHIPMYFLNPSEPHAATIYCDGDGADWRTSPLEYKIDHRDVSTNEVLTIRMASGGGFAVVIR